VSWQHEDSTKLRSYVADPVLVKSLFDCPPLDPILGDTSAGGDFMPGRDVFLPISPLYCLNWRLFLLHLFPLCPARDRPPVDRYVAAPRTGRPKPDAIPISTPVSFRAYLNLRTKLLNYPTHLSFAGPNPYPRDYVYESCRLSAMMLLNSLDQSLPLGICEMNRPIVA
jgi:hypothetical protein